MIITLHQSLSFDTIIKPHARRIEAEAHMVKVLTDAGWPANEAVQAAEKGDPVLVEDNGDGETIEIRELNNG
jgi:hypothetical protein